nr:TonB-dependent receptor [Novosphingobium flavum]
MLASAAAGAVATSASAQVNGAPAQAQSSSSETQPNPDQLADIVVTATRRVERLQDVPVSVAAVGGDALQSSGSAKVQDLSSFVPSLRFAETATGQMVNIRGVGSGSGNAAFEQSVATFVDGIYYSRSVLTKSVFLDTDRVEVVRGPQPLFAGQNAIAGAINIINRKPGNTWNGYVLGSYGSSKEGSIEGAFGGPLTDTFGVRAAARYYKLGQNQPDAVTGRQNGITRDIAARLIAEWKPIENITATLKYEHQDVRGTGLASETVGCDLNPQTSGAALSPPYAAAGPYTGRPAPCTVQALAGLGNFALDRVTENAGTLDYVALINQINAAHVGQPGYPLSSGAIRAGLNKLPVYNNNDRKFYSNIVAGTLDADLGGVSLTSTTGYIAYKADFWADIDGTSIAFFQDHRPESFTQFSQELRLASRGTSSFRWMIGAYYQKNHLDTTDELFLPLGTSPGANLDEHARSLGAFASLSYNLTDQLTVNAGARYTDLRKRAVLSNSVATLGVGDTAFGPRTPGNVNLPLAFDDSDFNPEVGLQWKQGDVMLYGRYAQAFKGGGFVFGAPLGAFPPPRTIFASEKARTFELGAKTQLFNRRLTANLTLFTTDVTNLQVSVFDPNSGSFVTSNAAAARNRGIELDGRVLLARNFIVGFGASLLDATYRNYAGASCYALQGKQFTQQTGQPAGLCTQDLSGRRIPFASPWSVSLTPDLKIDLAEGWQATLGGTLFVSGPYNINANLDPFFRNDTYATVDMRLGIGPSNGRWTVTGYVNNLTNKRVLNFSANSLFNRSNDANTRDGIPVVSNRERSYGVQARLTF